MIERTTLTVTSTSATGFGAEQHEETRIIPRQATIQDLIDMLELCDTSDRVDQVTIAGEEPVKDLYMIGVPEKPSDGLSDPDPSPSAGKTGKHADGAKEEQTTATEEEA